MYYCLKQKLIDSIELILYISVITSTVSVMARHRTPQSCVYGIDHELECSEVSVAAKRFTGSRKLEEHFLELIEIAISRKRKESLSLDFFLFIFHVSKF